METDLQVFFKDLQQRKIITNHANLDNFFSLKSEERVIYWGIDCTGNSLHVGHLFALLQTVRFAKENFSIILIIGGATSKIGDPSDKLKERPQLPVEVIKDNYAKIEEQLKNLLIKPKGIKALNFSPLELFFSDNKELLTSIYQILELEGNNNEIWAKYFQYIWPLKGKENKFQILNNQQWLDKLSFVDFIDRVGRNITINYLLAKETIKQRVNSENGLSFLAFSYSLLQAYDFYYLYEKYQCCGQLGASDQWGNLTTGLKLIHSYYPQNKTFAFTWDLLVDKEGKKISKTATNQKTLWLDRQKTSLQEAYNFFNNMPDEQAFNFVRQFTFLSEQQTNQLLSLNNPPKLRILQRVLLELFFYLLYQQEGLEWLEKRL